jgi:hypothetical protein
LGRAAEAWGEATAFRANAPPTDDPATSDLMKVRRFTLIPSFTLRGRVRD